MKRLVITGTSSMQAWDGGAQLVARPSRVTSPSSFATTSSELAGYSTLPAGCTYPVEILVDGNGNRARSQKWAAHSRTAPMPPGSLLEIGNGCYLTAPEEFFLKQAPKLSLPRAVLLGMELCGYYSTLMSVPYREYRDRQIRHEHLPLKTKIWPPVEWDLSLEHQRNLMDLGFVQRRPLTTASGVARFLNRALSTSSNSRARIAAALLTDNAQSPMESRLYARYCLPKRYGGLNLLPVEINTNIPLTPELAAAVGFDSYSVDLYWRSAGIAIEYEGAFAHTGLDAESKDRLKRNLLESTGVRIISIDRTQFRNDDVLDHYGKEIARRLKHRSSRLKMTAKERLARYELLDELSSWDNDLYRMSSTPGV